MPQARQEELDAIDPGWCPARDTGWQRCYRLVQNTIQAGGTLTEAAGDVVVQGEDLGRWVTVPCPDRADRAVRRDRAGPVVVGIGDVESTDAVHHHVHRGLQRGRGCRAAVTAEACDARASDRADLLYYHLDSSVGSFFRSELRAPVRRDVDELLIRNSLGSLVEDVSDVRGFEVAGDDVGLALSAVE
ncbi:hypothetical protein ABZ587_44290, partial [Streptomyces sp. NPDC018352]